MSDQVLQIYRIALTDVIVGTSFITTPGVDKDNSPHLPVLGSFGLG